LWGNGLGEGSWLHLGRRGKEKQWQVWELQHFIRGGGSVAFGDEESGMFGEETRPGHKFE
jgi:hypothetical protein